tara:strand:- start:150156 stop:152768 length:2613 start_codon:yes stop_codon:yes gene_type:complete
MYIRLAVAIAFISNTLSTSLVHAKPFVKGADVYEYNPGPDIGTPMGRMLADIFAEQPYYRAFSDELMEDQKFRFIFGLMMTRSYFEPNSVKIFFWGQDATHIAEASKQPGTSGFGGRVQDIANFFGVDQGVATSNAFLSTIKGQFGAFDHPFVKTNADGSKTLTTNKYIDNELWMLANDDDSEIRIQREKYFEWVIMNNPESLGMIAMFGDAAKHAFAQFLIARGAEVPTKTTNEDLKTLEVPETRLVNAGGNAEFAVPVDKDGNDIYQILENEKAKSEGRTAKRLDYSKSDPKDMKKMLDQIYAIQLAKEAGQHAIDMMVFTKGGVNGSGMMNAAQAGGYDLTKVKINGKITNSLKGLKLLYFKGKAIDRDIAFVESPHPTALSQMKPDQAALTLKKAFSVLEPLKALGWMIKPDLDNEGNPRRNQWHEGDTYKYGRADIRAGFFEFGAPTDRRASSADAIRLNPQAIIIGSRQKVDFNRQTLANMEKAMPSDFPNADDLWSVRPRNMEQRYDFDRGPGEDVAKAIMTALEASRAQIFAVKPGIEIKKDNRGNDTTFDFYGINAYYSKTVPDTGFFGMHRGSFTDARVLIMADPHGIDDWNTARALTGARGQYLNGLMNDLGIGKDYLVIKTAPLGMDGATAEEWEYVRKHTEGYREAALKEALKNKNLEFVMADGPIAQIELQRLLKKLKRTDLTVIDINRDGMVAESGISEAGEAVKALNKSFSKAQISVKMKDIPRGHLTWWSRSWEGTSGDLVINASGKAAGKVKAIVTPDWVVNQKVHITAREQASIDKLRKDMEVAGLKLGSETFQSFFERAARMKRAVEEKVGDMIAKVRGKKQTESMKPVASLSERQSENQCVQFYFKQAK